MSERWSWTYEDASGAPMTDEALPSSTFPTQADAESWFGEEWHDLADAGVAAVTLHRDGEVVYGPMRLDPPA